MSIPDRPTISLVTPSFNQAAYLEATLKSVLTQDYPALQHVVMDGGSTDGSRDIIRRYAERLHFWTSERDAGQYDAINKGFAHTQGEIMAWLNSDDLYFPWTLDVVAQIFAAHPEIQWLTSAALVQWDAAGRAVVTQRSEGYHREAFLRGRNLPLRGFATHYVMQEVTFWRRSLWEAAGGYVDAKSPLAGDFDLWARFYQHAELYSTSALLGGFRMHGGQKTAHGRERYEAEAWEILQRHGGRRLTPLEVRLHQLKRRLPGASRWAGWDAPWVEYDHGTQTWRIERRRFI